MQRNINSLAGFTIGATDGEIGKVEEFYFDDKTWTVRYMIVKTGGWLTGRKVLIAPEALLQPDWANKILPVKLTRSQIENSPDIDTDKTISRQHENALFAYYPWQNYYDIGMFGESVGMMGAFPLPPVVDAAIPGAGQDSSAKKQEPDPHLRSTHDMKGYSIHANDGEIGEVTDFIFDEEKWNISFLVVDTGTLLHGKKVLLSPAWIKEIQWNVKEVIVNVSINDVMNSPEYDPSNPLDSGYTQGLHDHYGFRSRK
ncbi:MAG: PRC-barrel domain-containing protein [Ginsengibacter sp.]